MEGAGPAEEDPCESPREEEVEEEEEVLHQAREVEAEEGVDRHGRLWNIYILSRVMLRCISMAIVRNLFMAGLEIQNFRMFRSMNRAVRLSSRRGIRLVLA